jgi:hypothetical protein
MERSYGFPSNFASKQIFFIAHIGEIYYMLQSTLVLENSQNLWHKYESVSRFLIDPISITYMLHFSARKFSKFMAKI